MNIYRESRAIRVLALLGGALVSGLCSPLHAETLNVTNPVFEAAFQSANKPEFMKNQRLFIGGRLDTGVSSSAISPDRPAAGTGLNERGAEPQVTQIHLYQQREVDQSGVFLGVRRAF